MNENNRRQLASLDDMLGGSDNNQSGTELYQLPIESLSPYPEHPYELYTGKRLQQMVESIQEHGVIQPIIVWLKDDSHIILSGHNRVNAAQLAGLTKVPAVIKENLTEADAALIVTETNLKQRSMSDLTHTQRAAAITAHYTAMKAKGKQRKLIEEIDAMLCDPVGNKRSIEKTIETFELSQGAIARYLRIGKLHPKLGQELDQGHLSIRAAVELSWLEWEHQEIIANRLADGGILSMATAKVLREQASLLNEQKIATLMEGKQKTPTCSIPISREQYTKYFTDKPLKEVVELINKALAAYFEQ